MLIGDIFRCSLIPSQTDGYAALQYVQHSSAFVQPSMILCLSFTHSILYFVKEQFNFGNPTLEGDRKTDGFTDFAALLTGTCSAAPGSWKATSVF